MNDEELRDCFAMFRSITGDTPEQCYHFASLMMEVRKKNFWVEPEEEEGGITSVVRRRRKKD